MILRNQALGCSVDAGSAARAGGRGERHLTSVRDVVSESFLEAAMGLIGVWGRAGLQMVPFFEDFDKLRTGYCAPQVFTRVMCTLGLDGLGAELDVLAAIYQSDSHKDRSVATIITDSKNHFVHMRPHALRGGQAAVDVCVVRVLRCWRRLDSEP
jgi:hypothetical protein